MDEKGFDYMNVIPLVDVMMVLLTIVLMTSSFIASGAIPVELPKAKQSRNDAVVTIVVAIDKNGAIYLDTTPTTLQGLQEKLVKIGRDRPIMVRADRSLSIQHCVDVLDLLSQEGFKKVALQTDKHQ